MRAGTKADCLARAALVLLVLVLFREALAGGVFYERDIHLIWYPQVEGFVRAVAEGALPLWDPSPAFGLPLLANPTAQVLYPPTWLNLVLRPWTYYTLFTCAHAIFSALAFFALARRWRLCPLASATGAALWVLSGPYLSLLTLTLHHFTSASYIPAVFLGVERALETRRVRVVVLLGVVLALQILGGSPDYCLWTFASVAIWTAVAHGQWRGWRELRRVILGGAAALVVAAALSAGLWLSAFDFASRSSRRELPSAAASYWSVHPFGLLGTLLAGVPGSLPLAPSWRAALFEGREPFLGSLYLGICALGLVGAAFVPGQSRSRRHWGLLGVGLVAVALALGRHTPLYDWVSALAPPLRSVRYPVKAMTLVAFCWAGLAAFGVQAWQDRPGAAGGERVKRRSERAWVGLVVAPSALATIAAAALALAILADQPLRAVAPRLLATQELASLRPLALALAAHAGLAALVTGLGLLPSRGRARAVAVAVAALAVLDLLVAHPRPGRLASRELFTFRPPVLDAMGDPRSVRIYSYDYGDRERPPSAPGPETVQRLAGLPVGWSVDATLALAQQMSLAPQTAGRWGLRQAFDADYLGLQPRPLAYLTRLARVRESDPDEIVRLLRLCSVSHVVAQHRLAGERLRLVAEVRGLFVAPTLLLAVPDPLPRARVVAGVRTADGLAALGALLEPGFDPERTVLLPEGSPRREPAGFAGQARIVEERADLVRLEVETSSEGFLVLADTYDPGWRTTVDGRAAPLLRANVAFRAVALAAGRHRVEMVYRPALAILGILVSLVALLGTVLLLVSSRLAGPERPSEIALPGFGWR